MWWLLPVLAGRLVVRPLLKAWIASQPDDARSGNRSYTCSRCHTMLQEGMRSCSQCGLRFPSPVPPAHSQDEPLGTAISRDARMNVQSGHRIEMRLPQRASVIIGECCSKCGASKAKWADTAKGICALCGERL